MQLINLPFIRDLILLLYLLCLLYKRPPYFICTIIVAVTEGLVREEQLLHDMCLLGAVTVEITQILTRAGIYYD